MRYFLYARKSSEGEDRQVQSIDDQCDELRRLAKSRDLTVVAELTEAHSAKSPGDRAVFGEMLRRIRAGEADGILCWAINRLFRNSVDYGEIAWLLQQGVIKSIQTIDREYLPEDNVLLMAVEAGVATQYVIDLRKAVKRGLASKAAKGWYPTRAPLGYRNNKETAQIDPDPKKFPLLQRAWKMMETGCYTVPQIGELLCSWGFPKTSRSNLYKLFDNPFYYGTFRYAGELYPGRHRPMVSRSTFEQVQRIIHKPSHIQPKKHEFAFTGLMRCGVCGCLITAERRVKNYKTTGNTRVYTYYHCTGSKGCSASGVREEYIESRIAEVLERCRLDPEFQKEAERMVQDWKERKAKTGVSDEALLHGSLRRLSQRSERLLELRLAGELNAEEYRQEKYKTLDEIGQIEERLHGLNEKDDRDRTTFKNVIRFATHGPDAFRVADTRDKRAIATVLASEYRLTLGDLEITPHPILAKICTFEPPQAGELQVRSRPRGPKSPLVWSLLDNIRNLITEGDYRFDYETEDRSQGPLA